MAKNKKGFIWVAGWEDKTDAPEMEWLDEEEEEELMERRWKELDEVEPPIWCAFRKLGWREEQKDMEFCGFTIPQGTGNIYSKEGELVAMLYRWRDSETYFLDYSLYVNPKYVEAYKKAEAECYKQQSKPMEEQHG